MNQLTKKTLSKTDLSTSLIILMSVASAICVANLYYSQPLLSNLSSFFHVSSTIVGISASLIQVGFAIGLTFLVPLGDIIKLRKLIFIMLICSIAALLNISFATNITWFIIASLFVGITSITQMLLVTLAAHLAKTDSRGQVIGNIMTGLLVGMLLSRTFSGIIGTHWNWQIVYRIAALMIGLILIIFYFFLPEFTPSSNMNYGKLIISLGHILKKQAVLRRSAIIGSMMFAAFSVLWTALSFYLQSNVYNLGAQVAGMFGLLGIAGALAASITGRIVDKKGPYFTLTIGISLSMIGFISFLFFGSHMWGLILGIILLDFGIQTAQISNQAKINTLDSSLRSRNNGVYMAFYFIGGSIGSFLSSYIWGLFGWIGICIIGIIFLLLAFSAHLFDIKHTATTLN